MVDFRLVYRDIKPEVRQCLSSKSLNVVFATLNVALTDVFCCGNQKNIGFDVRGDVKVFDFGLCKDLDPRLKNKDGDGYRLTGRAGSLPYSEYRFW